MIKVYDNEENEKSLQWALDKYNPILKVVAKSHDHWEIVELREVIGPSSMTVRLTNNAVLVPVAFHWPPGDDGDIGDQQPTHPSEPKPHAIKQRTNADGHTGFGMGGGAYYRPDQGEHGPHAVWVSQYPEVASDLVDGLGMIGRTNHAHLEPTFQFVLGGEEPEPEEGRTFKIKLEGTLTLIEQ